MIRCHGREGADVEFAQLQQWIGRQQQASDEVTLPLVERLAATLDIAPISRKRGEPIPEGWYSVLFGPTERQSGLAVDGHPAKGQFLPPVPLPRRMFAGRRVQFLDALRIGDEVNRVSRIERIEPKQGRSGQMCFVTTRHEMSTSRGMAVVEEQDLVYREDIKPDATKREAAPAQASGPANWSRSLAVDEAMLFRYSALTFNSHRIHYDRRYAQDEEGYAGLVVHGPLVATFLVDLVHREIPGARLASFEFRGVRPLLDTASFKVCGRRVADGSISLWAQDAEGRIATRAAARLARE